MKILIADDHTIVREGVKHILKQLPYVTHIEETSNGHEALEKIRQEDYGLVVLDISMPGLGGLDILQHLQKLGLKRRILMLSLHPEEQYAIRALKLGASGYIQKESAFGEISEALKTIIAGGKYISPALADRILFKDISKRDALPHEQLSEREFQVMLMLAGGHSVGNIASQLYISHKTVSTYRSRIMKKMGMKTNPELTLYAIRHALIDPDSE